jgi:hypothetical protein
VRELKTVSCKGDMIAGDIFEVVDANENYHLHFRIDEMAGGLVSGGQTTKKIRLRYTLEELREVKEELSTVIARMEKEL